MRISRLPPSRRVWIFDLDNTLHDARAHIFPSMHEQMNAYLQRRFGLDEEGANGMRRVFWQRYGTTLRGPDAPPRRRSEAIPRRDAPVSRARRHGGGRERARARAARASAASASCSPTRRATTWRRCCARSASRATSTRSTPSRAPATAASRRLGLSPPAARAQPRPAPLRADRRHAREPARREAPGHVDGLGERRRAGACLSSTCASPRSRNCRVVSGPEV